MKITIQNSEYNVIDAKEKITIADSFVVRSNKIGTGSGEAKLYIGNDNKELRDFFGSPGFKNKCFILKKDLLSYMEENAAEYQNPTQIYQKPEQLPILWNERIAKIEKLPEILYFEISEQTQIAGPRVYIKSEEEPYELIRELSLPNVSYISIVKIEKFFDNQDGYYFRLFADYFDEYENSFSIQKIEETINNQTVDQTVRTSLIKARVGQGEYRKKLLDLCPFCPISMVSDERVLIASHIKPWAKCDNLEKIDPLNGFMLTPNYDLLFDRGFLSFTNDKKTILSPFLSNMTYSKLNISDGKLIANLPTEGRESYLEYHRNNILKK